MACSWEQALSLEVFYNATIGECVCVCMLTYQWFHYSSIIDTVSRPTVSSCLFHLLVQQVGTQSWSLCALLRTQGRYAG